MFRSLSIYTKKKYQLFAQLGSALSKSWYKFGEIAALFQCWVLTWTWKQIKNTRKKVKQSKKTNNIISIHITHKRAINELFNLGGRIHNKMSFVHTLQRKWINKFTPKMDWCVPFIDQFCKRLTRKISIKMFFKINVEIRCDWSAQFVFLLLGKWKEEKNESKRLKLRSIRTMTT